jgi:carboxypeptidase T
MDIKKIESSEAYRFSVGEANRLVNPEKNDVAQVIDTNKDHFISDKEIKDYLKNPKIDILRDPKVCDVDEKAVVKEFKTSLQKKIPARAADYHDYNSITKELKDLEKAYPNLAKMVSLGKTVEGRDIWALKLSKDINSDTSSKTGVVFTGATHAREWASAEVPLYMAQTILDNNTDPKNQKRLEQAEIWIIPVANPDGYQYSRTEDTMWRKNRDPITHTGCETNAEGNICDIKPGADKVYGMGVDINRNYDDGKPEHAELYRPKGDTPCSTWDDFSATSDDPDDDTYRGPSGASEIETKSLLNLELGNKNIKGIIDHHSYGNMILYPWGHTHDEAPNAAMYKELGKGMAKAMKEPYKVMQSADLYPASGSSENIHNINNRTSYTIEMGRSFQPSGGELEKIKDNVLAADMYFLDYMIDHKTEPA